MGARFFEKSAKNEPIFEQILLVALPLCRSVALPLCRFVALPLCHFAVALEAILSQKEKEK